MYHYDSCFPFLPITGHYRRVKTFLKDLFFIFLVPRTALRGVVGVLWWQEELTFSLTWRAFSSGMIVIHFKCTDAQPTVWIETLLLCNNYNWETEINTINDILCSLQTHITVNCEGMQATLTRNQRYLQSDSIFPPCSDSTPPQHPLPRMICNPWVVDIEGNKVRLPQPELCTRTTDFLTCCPSLLQDDEPSHCKKQYSFQPLLIEGRWPWD